MGEVTEKKAYPAVDFFKFFCCLLIIAIHAKPFEQNFWLDAGVGLITRFAVPYFFVATGFFFFHSVNGRLDKRKYLIKYEVRMIRLYAVWFFIQTAQDILRGSIHNPFYYVRHFIWPNNGIILWFLPATMFAVFVVYEFSKLMNPRDVFGISIIIWLIGYCFSTVAPLFEETLLSDDIIKFVQSTIGIQNGLFFGFPYIALSQLLATSKNEKNHIRDSIGIIISFCCLGLESLIIVMMVHPSLTFLWLCALPLTYFTFHLTLGIQLAEKPIYIFLRKISTLVYVIHPIVLKGLQDLFEKIGFTDFYNLVLFFTVSAISLLLATVIYQRSLKEKYKILGLLI